VKVKLNPGLTNGFHAAFENRIFDRIRFIGNNLEKSESDGDDNHKKGEKNGNDEK
jgi:hypothetical protein